MAKGIDCRVPYEDTQYERRNGSSVATKVQKHRIDVPTLWHELRPYLGQHQWTETRRGERENEVVRYMTLIRDDGLVIDIHVADSWYDDQTKVTVSAGTFKKPSGEDVNLKWIMRKEGDSYGVDNRPSATIDITKRDTKAIAADITRRVIEPLAAVLSKIRESQSADASRLASLASTMTTLAKIKGMKVCDGQRGGVSSRTGYALCDVADFSIGYDGAISIEKFDVAPDNVAELVTLLRSFKARAGK